MLCTQRPDQRSLSYAQTIIEPPLSYWPLLDTSSMMLVPYLGHWVAEGAVGVGALLEAAERGTWAAAGGTALAEAAEGVEVAVGGWSRPLHIASIELMPLSVPEGLGSLRSRTHGVLQLAGTLPLTCQSM